MGKCEIPAHVVEIANVYYVEAPLSDGAVAAGEPEWNRFRMARMPIATKMQHGVVLFTEYAAQTARGPAPENRRELALGPGAPAWLLGALAEALLRTGDKLRSCFTAARCWVGYAADGNPPALPSEQDMALHQAACQLMRNLEAAAATDTQGAIAAPSEPATGSAMAPGQKSIGDAAPIGRDRSVWNALA